MCAVQRDGDGSVLERLPISVCAEISQAGGFPGQPEAQSTTRARATGTAAGRGTHTYVLSHPKKDSASVLCLVYFINAPKPKRCTKLASIEICG